jgi:predicted secreted hydrolase
MGVNHLRKAMSVFSALILCLFFLFGPRVSFAQTPQTNRGVDDINQIAAHPGTSLQWWYLTGPLWKDEACDSQTGFALSGRDPDWGTQLTFFYRGQGNTQGLLLHSALSDVASKSHDFASLAEPWKPGAMSGIFGRADAESLRLRLGQHQLAEVVDLSRQVGGQVKTPPLQTPLVQMKNGRWWAQYSTGKYEIDLEIDLVNAKIWAHGDAGYVQKTKQTGNVYVSYPFLPARGTLRDLAKGSRHAVCGSVWFDHEVGVQNVQGVSWQWFALRFADGRSYMIYRVTDTRSSSAADVTLTGEKYRLETNGGEKLHDVAIVASDSVCLKSGNCYPQKFSISFRERKADRTQVLTVDSFFSEQEMKTETSKVYWEGMVRVRDADGEIGLGYVELTQ